MTSTQIWEFVNREWDHSVVPLISDYIAIPNVSPLFDQQWETNGLMDKAATLLYEWALKQKVVGLSSEFIKTPGKTPLLYFAIQATHPDKNKTSVLMYGHLDKQPPLTESWCEGLHPYKPVYKDGKLYGRGGADDGYSICAAILAVKALQTQGIPHSHIVIIIEASEESGSVDLPYYIDRLEKQIGTPSLIVCLDSGAGNYEQFWTTTTLRGLIAGDLVVSVLEEGAHSGQASGIVPSSFRILRLLLDRIEDAATGEILVKELHTEISETRKKEIRNCASSLGPLIYQEFKFKGSTTPVSSDLYTLLVNRTWKPTLSITGIDGIPPLSCAGNVLRTQTAVKLSIRLPPSVDADKASLALQKVLLTAPPYGASVTFNIDKAKSGFCAPELAPWLSESLNKTCSFYTKQPPNFIGEGGSIPFMGMLREKFPQAQFVITGVLGPGSNAHGPNEFLHVNLGKMVTACVSGILSDHEKHFVK
eukprot:TRINITY_DN5691_c0_g1_i1.p1 TRINITY_DN5691_c0_g1~~TRINITY_DN5691_c0_g1_i1.p1  ORF type:complete len:477 (+),score=94.14 TRINITY_DN5691_c0_g1_i1:24-1454(+)